LINRTTKRLKQAVRSLQKRFTTSAVILHYHRVADLSGDPFLLNVMPHLFEEHLKVVKTLGEPVSLTKLTDALRRGELPRRAIVVTFDDGYADNLHHAKPLLERHGVPATVFVATGAVESQREFWWDELERLVLEPGELPSRLQLNVNGSVQQWELGPFAVYTEDDRRRHCAWTLATQSNPSSRHRVLRELYERIYPLNDTEKWRVLDELALLSSLGRNTRPTHRPMRGDEIIELARDGLIDIGAHTQTHTPLTSLLVAGQRQEIEGSKIRLEQILSRPIKHFAYPHGLFTAETVEVLRQVGITAACTTLPGPVRRKSNLLRLPRMLVMNWSGKQLAEHLEHSFTE
jgi:peptidoglycan/xylan/chitin deacetylase (PgdA/CDA1 family)